MPVVLVTDAPTLWGSEYADIVGVQYEFPVRYRNLVAEGDRFLYYRGSRGAALGAGYFGEGVVGKIQASAKAEHLIAEVHDVLLFGDVVSIKDAAGNYFETGSTTGTNWANGVRRVPDGRYNQVMHAAEQLPDPPRKAPGFASPEHAKNMERYSVKVVLALLRDEFGDTAVQEMPPNNPGYDIAVLNHSSEVHVEVKGTLLPAPSFHLSEGQRSHAELRGEGWRLYVVYGIDVRESQHEVDWCNGTQLSAWARLTPEAWRGTLRNPASARGT